MVVCTRVCLAQAIVCCCTCHGIWWPLRATTKDKSCSSSHQMRRRLRRTGPDCAAGAAIPGRQCRLSRPGWGRDNNPANDPRAPGNAWPATAMPAVSMLPQWPWGGKPPSCWRRSLAAHRQQPLCSPSAPIRHPFRPTSAAAAQPLLPPASRGPLAPSVVQRLSTDNCKQHML